MHSLLTAPSSIVRSSSTVLKSDDYSSVIVVIFTTISVGFNSQFAVVLEDGLRFTWVTATWESWSWFVSRTGLIWLWLADTHKIDRQTGRPAESAKSGTSKRFAHHSVSDVPFGLFAYRCLLVWSWVVAWMSPCEYLYVSRGACGRMNVKPFWHLTSGRKYIVVCVSFPVPLARYGYMYGETRTDTSSRAIDQATRNAQAHVQSVIDQRFIRSGLAHIQ